MAVRVNIADVKSIINTSVLDPDIETYIAIASGMVDRYLADSELSDALETEIERWLTAHLIAVTRERQGKRETVDDVSIEYTGIFGEGLKSTTYGQMVIMLDTSGEMAKIGEGVKKSATIRAITSFE